MRHLKLIVEYDGTLFSGWARQPGKRTVQGCLESALSEVTGERVRVGSASRTDAGVHAEGQVVSFKTESKIPVLKLSEVLVPELPEDILVRSAEEVGADFDARRSARCKVYSYMIVNGARANPVARRYVWCVPGHLDIRAMKKAAAGLVGRKDFTSFALTDKRRKLGDPFREIFSIRVRSGKLSEFFGRLGENCGGKAIRLEFRGDGFLYKMVRSLVGTMVDVGRGRLGAADIRSILASRKRSAAGRTAPAKGLTLVRVEY